MKTYKTTMYIQAKDILGVFCEVLLDLGFTSFTRYSILSIRDKVEKNLEKVNATLEFNRDQCNNCLRSKEFNKNNDKDNEIYKFTIKPEYRKNNYFRKNYFCLANRYFNNIYDTIRQSIEKEGLYLDTTDKILTIEGVRLITESKEDAHYKKKCAEALDLLMEVAYEYCAEHKDLICGTHRCLFFNCGECELKQTIKTIEDLHL